MDMVNPSVRPFAPEDDRQARLFRRRGALFISKKEQTEEDKKWFGLAPRPIPETDRSFRPKEFPW